MTYKQLFMLAGTFFFMSCSDVERSNPNDPGSDKYRGWQILEPPLSSSSVAAASSSSSAPPPGSSSGLCADFVDGTERKHYEKMKPQFCDERDGQKYVYVKIDTQTWMAENLNYNASGRCGDGDWLSDKNTTTCDTYGRLYDWVTAMALPFTCKSTSCASQVNAKHRGICPSGWHLPSDADWNVLMKFVNPACLDNALYCEGEGAGTKLKATSGWNEYNGKSSNGTDDYSFAAL